MNSGDRDGLSESRWRAWSIGGELKSVVGAKPFHETRDALGQLDARRKAEIARGTRNVGIGFVDVAGRTILIADIGLAAGGLFDDADQAGDLFRLLLPKL